MTDGPASQLKRSGSVEKVSAQDQEPSSAGAVKATAEVPVDAENDGDKVDESSMQRNSERRKMKKSDEGDAMETFDDRNPAERTMVPKEDEGSRKP
jgi:hypothetical protein